MKKRTEEQISKAATEIINYLNKKSGWRGFIEGALWMQDLALRQAPVSGSWTLSEIKPQHNRIVAVLLKGKKYPSLAHYNKKFDEWVIEEKNIKGEVEYWYELPMDNYL